MTHPRVAVSFCALFLGTLGVAPPSIQAQQGGVSVIVKARLVEVDDDFHKKLKTAKRISTEEAEQKFLAGIATEWDVLFNLLKKQPTILLGEDIKRLDGVEVKLLSRHKGVQCLASPEQIRKGKKDPQTVMEGVTFQGRIHVSPDRRFVRIEFTEKAEEFQ